MLKITTGLPFNCNKNVDIKLSVHVSVITFIGYAQSRKVRKTNNLRQEWLLREKGKFKSLDVTAICPSLLYSGIRAGSIQIYTLVSYVRTMDSPKLLYPNTLITYNRSKTLKKTWKLENYWYHFPYFDSRIHHIVYLNFVNICFNYLWTISLW